MSEQVICLSDSDESIKSLTHEKLPTRNYGDESDFDFPAVDFTYCVNEPPNKNVKKNDKDNAKSTRDKSIEDHHRNVDDAREKNAEKNILPNSTAANKKKEKPKGPVDLDKETRAKQTAIEKCQKIAQRMNLKRIQPGECLKHMLVSLDRGLENFEFYRCVIESLVDSDISWDLESLAVENSILWTRETEQHYVNDRNEICTKKDRQTEKQIVVIWNRDETAARVKEGSFVGALKRAMNLVPGMRPTLVLYGLEQCFKSKDRDAKQSSKSNSKATKISRSTLEICLAEIQLVLNCSSQLVDAPQDLASLIYRYTKSIAETPYKLDKKQKLEEKLDWFATGDNRDTVRVDKDGHGLKRLWQQQLCQFNLASLETAESVSSVYPSPLRLMEAYQNCTIDQGEKLLKDIPIRRAAGPLSTVRKIGPELSKKIFLMFTSKDGEAALGNDKEL